jgi:hypothetical protein
VSLTTEEFLEARIDASPVPAATRLLLGRPPITKDELWWVVHALWDVGLPRKSVCIDHQAPFDAFADAYFGNEANWALWYGSRGTGKSYMLAILALTVAAIKEVNVTLLGGSMAQSQNVHEHVENLLKAPNAPAQMVENSIQSETSFGPGNWIRPLPASQKTVRGPHPTMTLLDEIDEMDKPVYDAAMGQALEQPNKRGVVVQEMVVASSTWQNPIGTFQMVIDDAREKGMPIFIWCWREVVKPHGWMSPEFIERKRRSVPAEMFRVEYELGEPAGDARAFDLNKVNQYFIEYPTPVDERHAGGDDEWIWEKPEPGGVYAAGADWAKQKDMTVIGVCRIDVFPRRMVYLRRLNRRPWPTMIGYFDKVIKDYQAVSAHDATGLGNVVHDLVESERTLKVVMIGRDRTKLLSEYIADFEHGVYLLPRVAPLFNAHRGTTVDEVWGTARWDSHLPDDVAMMAILHRAAERAPLPADAQGVAKTPEGPRAYRPLERDIEDGLTSRPDGVVERREAFEDVISIPMGSSVERPDLVERDYGGGVFNL